MPGWTSPYRNADIQTLVNAALPNRAQQGILQRWLWRLGGWAREELLDTALKALPEVVLPKEALEETIKDYQAVRLSRELARRLLLAPVDADELPDVSQLAVKELAGKMFGTTPETDPFPYGVILTLVGGELDRVGASEAQLSRIVEVRKTVLRQLAAGVSDPNATDNSWARLTRNSMKLQRDLQIETTRIREALVALYTVNQMGGRIPPNVRSGVLREVERAAEECLTKLCTWTLSHLVAPARREGGVVSANFMLLCKSGVAHRDSDGAREASTIWSGSRYAECPKQRLEILWSTDATLVGFWIPEVDAAPALPGAHTAFRSRQADAVIKDDIEARWPAGNAELLGRVQAHYGRQFYNSFLSIPVWRPGHHGDSPIGVLNLNISLTDFALYERARVRRIADLLQPAVDSIGEMAVCFESAVTSMSLQTLGSTPPIRIGDQVRQIVALIAPPKKPGDPDAD